MKATKKLIQSLIVLFVSAALCVGVCLAWFTINDKVDANGLNPGLNDVNISELDVTAYTLEKTVGTENEYTVGADKGKPVIMEPYGNLEGKDTALLLKFTYSFNAELGKNYGIFVQYAKTLTNIANQLVTRTENDAQYEFKCDLSLTVSFYTVESVGVDGATVRKSSELIAEPDFQNKVNLNGGAAADKNGEPRVFWCIIDYEESKVEELYAYALDNLNGSLNSQMRFENDMSFYMAEV